MHVNVEYPEAILNIKDIKASIDAGDKVGDVQNGAGKTTTMKIILGLLKSDRGEVFVSGERVKYGQTATNR